MHLSDPAQVHRVDDARFGPDRSVMKCSGPRGELEDGARFSGNMERGGAAKVRHGGRKCLEHQFGPMGPFRPGLDRALRIEHSLTGDLRRPYVVEGVPLTFRAAPQSVKYLIQGQWWRCGIHVAGETRNPVARGQEIGQGPVDGANRRAKIVTIENHQRHEGPCARGYMHASHSQGSVLGSKSMTDVTVEIGEDHVATVEIHRGPNNFFDAAVMHTLADRIATLDTDEVCRAIVLVSEGKNFCAGARLTPSKSGVVFQGIGPTDHRRAEGNTAPSPSTGTLYDAAVRLFSGSKPIVAGIQGAAVGGGLGLALTADFRVASADSRFCVNFARLGFFPGFGITYTLPFVIGNQNAADLLYTGRRIDGVEAFRMGLCDRLVEDSAIRAEARTLASEIAKSGPLSVRRIRASLRGHLVEAVRTATARESEEQAQLAVTADFREGVTAMNERRLPVFQGR